MKPELFVETDLPNDQELERLTRYVGGYMSPEEVELFDRRLEEDREFFYRMAPMLDAWYAEPLPIELEVLAELDARERQEAAAIRPMLVSQPVRRTRWRPLVGWGGVALAAEVLLTFVRVGTQATQVTQMVAQTPRDTVPAVVAPPTQAPLVVVEHPRAPRRTAPVVVASVEPAVIAEPTAPKTDSATERMVAAMDSAQAAAGFIPPSRVADTVDASILPRPTVWMPAPMITGSIPQSSIPTGNPSNGAPVNQDRGGGLFGWIRGLLGGGKSSGAGKGSGGVKHSGGVRL
jgi:hypothetical protein